MRRQQWNSGLELAFTAVLFTDWICIKKMIVKQNLMDWQQKNTAQKNTVVHTLDNLYQIFMF